MPNQMNITQRLEALREVMQREHLSACIIPTSDPHRSEHIADHWKGCQWITGFNGSAGTAVVTLTSAALWTDSCYFLAAEEQLQGTEYQLMKEKIAGIPTIVEWLNKELMQSRHSKEDWSEVALDGLCSSVNEVKSLIADLRRANGITLRTNFDPLKLIWKDRPAIPEAHVSTSPLEYAGELVRDKISRIRKALREKHADGMLMARLDDIAWTLNLQDTEFVGYLLISSKSATLYINNKENFPPLGNILYVEDYEQVKNGLKKYFEYNILMDPDEVNYALYDFLKREGVRREGVKSPVRIVEETSPVPALTTHH